jgi:hypothetical protein
MRLARNGRVLRQHGSPARLTKCTREHLVLTLTISAASQDVGSANAFIARADVANESFDCESATHPVGIQVPYLDAGLSGFH